MSNLNPLLKLIGLIRRWLLSERDVETRVKLEIFFLALVVIFCLSAFGLLHVLFSHKLNDLSIEILAAALGTVIVVASVTITIHFQARLEETKEYQTKIFEEKLRLYKEFLDFLFSMDDDNIITREEIQKIENLSASLALIASEDVVLHLYWFITQLKIYGVLYPRNLSESQIEHFINNFGNDDFPLTTSLIELDEFNLETLEGKKELIKSIWTTPDDIIMSMREDLSVVKGNVREYIERFVTLKYNAYNMVKSPNIVD